jgi:hypothetical protein
VCPHQDLLLFFFHLIVIVLVTVIPTKQAPDFPVLKVVDIFIWQINGSLWTHRSSI